MPRSSCYSLAISLTMVGSPACYHGADLTPALSFDLPAGWDYIIQTPTYTAATANSRSKDGVAPLVKLETAENGIFIGDESDAKEYIEDNFRQQRRFEPAPGWPASELKTLDLPGGVKVHAIIRPDGFWASDEQLPWNSVIAYSQEDHVVVLYLGDRADSYMSELDIITSSTKILRK